MGLTPLSNSCSRDFCYVLPMSESPRNDAALPSSLAFTVPPHSLGSELQVASSSLTWLHKARTCRTTYPTPYPGMPSANMVTRNEPPRACYQQAVDLLTE
jgi:hypothetical protein